MSTTENEGFPAQPGEAPLEETLEPEIEEVHSEPIVEEPEITEESVSEPEPEIIDDGPKLIKPKSKTKE
jgi:hypothetical protein